MVEKRYINTIVQENFDELAKIFKPDFIVEETSNIVKGLENYLSPGRGFNFEGDLTQLPEYKLKWVDTIGGKVFLTEKGDQVLDGYRAEKGLPPTAKENQKTRKILLGQE